MLQVASPSRPGNPDGKFDVTRIDRPPSSGGLKYLGCGSMAATTGGRLCVFRYVRWKGRSCSRAAHSDVTLRRAREKRDAARRLVADGIAPIVQRQRDKATLGDPLRSYQMMMALHEAGENLRNNPAASA